MGKFAKYLDDMTGTVVATETGFPPTNAASMIAAPSPGTATTTATTPAERKVETVASGKRDLREGLSADRADAAMLGLRRGFAPGADRFAGIGADLGESIASLVHGLPAPAEDTAQKARDEYAAKEAAAAKDYPFTYGGFQALGSVPMTVGAAGAGLPLSGPATVAKVANSPAGRIATQNFATGYMNSPSDNPIERARAGAVSTAAGEVLGAGGEKVGKFLGGSVAREYRGLVKDIMRNSETEIAATATARKRFMERATSAVDETKKDPQLEKAIRSGDVEHAGSMARSKLQVISEPREGMYKQMDSLGMLTPSEIDAALAKKIATTTGATHDAFVGMRRELNDQWVSKWKNEGRLVMHGRGSIGPTGGQTQLPHVSGLGIREWVTDAQNASAIVIGGLEEGPRKKVKGALEDFAEDLWHNHMDKIAKQDPQLVRNIKEYDKRASGLIAIKDIMEQRARKDQEGLMGFAKRREGQIDALMTSGAGAGALLGHPGAAAVGYGAYQAAKRIPATASAINDKVLAPLQRAAMEGKSWAELVNQAAEVGVPQGIARAIWTAAQRARGDQSTDTSEPAGISKVTRPLGTAIFGPNDKQISTAVR